MTAGRLPSRPDPFCCFPRLAVQLRRPSRQRGIDVLIVGTFVPDLQKERFTISTLSTMCDVDF